MPLQQTSGNVTQDAYGGGAAYVPTYVENVFSTYVYTGNGTGSLSVPNKIDLLDNGGLVWTKERNNTGNHFLEDSARGWGYDLHTNNTASQDYGAGITPLTNGFTNTYGFGSSDNLVSWTFRKQPKFFDIQTWTGTGLAQTINHNLGCVPGFIITKNLSSSNNWFVYHIGMNGGTNPQNYSAVLNTNASQSGPGTPSVWNNTAPTSTNFNVSSVLSASGNNYIAYLFGAGGTGGFGLTGTQDIISCGSFTTDSSGNATVNFGWEPQWILYKATTGSGNSWFIVDVMRGMSQTLTSNLEPNLTNAENIASGLYVAPTATGITFNNGWLASSSSYIYIAIRRGPMATPTTGTSVFSPSGTVNASATPYTVTTGFPSDLAISTTTGGTGDYFIDRLRGSSQTSIVYLQSQSTSAEGSASGTGQGIGFDNNTAIVDAGFNGSTNAVYWNFARAPGFFDEVCYTGNGVTTTQITHNLGVAPQLLIVKSRSNASNWKVYSATVGNGYAMNLNYNSTPGAGAWWNNTNPTSTTFNVNGGSADLNASGYTYVAYLFATVTGVSYVGSYTGTGSTQSIACGFGAGGARFILAKRTDSTGDWYVFDSTRGLTSSSSPYLLLDSASAQITGNNGTYASSGGFTLTSSSPVNTSGGSFIFLAIA